MKIGISASPIKRKLTAILVADAVGYSRKMSENEEGTLQVLAAQRAIIDHLIVAHEGRIFGTAGDSVLAEFPSSVEAVRCAVEVQEALETRNQSLPQGQGLEFRIGINLGDVMVDGTDILGDGVNVAARIESIADPGGICISSSVYDQMVGKLSLRFVDLGPRALKNINRPIRVYRLDRSAEKSAAEHSAPRFGKSSLSIGGAVLLLLLTLGAWNAGLFERRSASVSVSAPLPDNRPPVHLLDNNSKETKLKLQIAEAERARAEAELARSRVDAELAKQRAASPPAERRSQVSPSSPRATNADQANSTGIRPADAAQSTVLGQSQSPPQVPVLTDSNSGIAIHSCEPFEEQPAFSMPISVRLINGEIIVTKGAPNKPGYILVTGRPSPEGNLILSGTYAATAKRLKGRQNQTRYEGSLHDGRYELVGFHGTRRCTMTIRMENHP